MGAFVLLAYAIGVILVLVLVSILGLTGYLYYVRSKYSHLPSPKLSNTLMGFYLGHLTYIIERRKSSKNDEHPGTELFIEWYRELGSPGVYVTFVIHIPFVILCDAESIKKVTMQIKNDKPKRFRSTSVFGERYLGNSLASITDFNTWKPRRKIYEHSFNKSYLKTLLPSFNECTDRLLDGIKPLADGKTTVYMKQHLAEVTLSVISKVAFGMDFSEKWDDKSLGLKWAKGTGKLTFLIAHTFKALQKETVQVNPLFRFLHPLEVRGYQETIRALRMIGRDCIMERIKAVEAGEEVPRDILSSILQVASTKETVDIEDLVDDFVLFYAAGQETTGNLLAFTTVMIHQFPDVLCRLQAEVEEVLKGRTEVTYEDLEKLQYTEQVLMEVLRMYPPLFAIGKEAMKGGIQIDEYFIPEGTTMFANVSGICRMPEYFDDPDTFDPSRFNPENKQPSSFVYFPFGLGHRSCIGKHFAMMEAKLILARLLQTFKFTLPPDYKLVVAQRLTLQPKDDVPCTVTLATAQ